MDFVRNRTLLIISHRLATITWVDRIIVLQNGNIVEEGSHSELYCDGTAYMHLWQEMSREDHAVRRSSPIPAIASFKI
jgi:ABC-type transport system involved in Fe-S cluster assembly fused permease/ATPase subunit